MPSALSYVPPYEEERRGYAMEVHRELTNRRTTYERALKYYEGKQPHQLTPLENQPDDNIVINMIRLTGDRTATNLFPDVPHVSIDPDSVDQTEQEQWAQEFLEANGGMETLVKMALRGFLSGHVFVKLAPPRPKDKYPRMILVDPMSVTAFWRADDEGEILWYEQRYMVGNVGFIHDYVRDETTDTWRVYTYVSKDTDSKVQLGDATTSHGQSINGFDRQRLLTGADWKVVKFDGLDYQEHTDPIPPIIEWPHLPHPNSFYGMSEATETQLQDAINRLWSQIIRIVRLHSNPKDVITGADVDDVQIGQDIYTVPDVGARVNRLEMKGDLEAAVRTVEKLIETYLAIVRVVLLKGEPKDLQRVTNASVRTLFIDALAKNEQLKSSYGKGLSRIIKLAMKMSGKEWAYKEYPVSLRFDSFLPLDMTEIANVAAIMKSMGSWSLRTVNDQMGTNWKFEQENIEEEAAWKAEIDKQVQEIVGFLEQNKPGGGAPNQNVDKPQKDDSLDSEREVKA